MLAEMALAAQAAQDQMRRDQGEVMRLPGENEG